MPGHIIHATCRCGYQKQLMPGAGGFGGKEYRMAYSASGCNEPVWKVKPCPSLEGFRDQDLRDTAVTWLARAGCTVPQIAAVTGHSETSVHSILKHYLALHPELADAAIARMTEWFDQHNSHNKALIAPK